MPDLPGTPELPRDRFQLGRVSESAAMAPGMALAQVGGDVRNVAQQAANVAESIQRTHDAGILAEARLRSQQAIAEHRLFREKQPDEQFWEADFRDRMQRAQGSFAEETIHYGDTRERLGRMFEEWQTVGVTSVQTDVQNQTVERATRRTNDAIEEHLKAGDTAGARGVAEEWRDLTNPLPEDYDALVADIEHKGQWYKVQQMISSDDPSGVLELLEQDIAGTHAEKNFPGLSMEDLGRLTSRARAAVQRDRADLFNEVMVQSLEDNWLVSPEDAIAMAEEGMWTYGQAHQYMMMRRASVPIVTDDAIYNSLARQIEVYDPLKDPTGKKFADIAAELASNAQVSDQHRQVLASRLRARTKGPEEAEDHPLLSYATRALDKQMTLGAFGEFEIDPDGGGPLRPVTSREKWMSANAKLRKAKTHLESWLQSEEGQKASQAEVDEVLRNLLQLHQGDDVRKAFKMPPVGVLPGVPDLGMGRRDDHDRLEEVIGPDPGHISVPALERGLPPHLKPLAAEFHAAGRRHGLDSRFLAAIAMHEVGASPSRAMTDLNNVMGVSDAAGPVRFPNVAASIHHQAAKLASNDGPYAGLNRIDEIGQVYAPIGAGNDPKGLNKNWAPMVSAHLKNFGVSDAGEFIARLGPAELINPLLPGKGGSPDEIDVSNLSWEKIQERYFAMFPGVTYEQANQDLMGPGGLYSRWVEELGKPIKRTPRKREGLNFDVDPE